MTLHQTVAHILAIIDRLVRLYTYDLRPVSAALMAIGTTPALKASSTVAVYAALLCCAVLSMVPACLLSTIWGCRLGVSADCDICLNLSAPATDNKPCMCVR